MNELIFFSVIYAVLAIGNLYRLIKGPTAADRMTAGDCMDIHIALAMVLYALYTDRMIFLDIAIIAAMLGIIDTMLVGRYLDTGRWRKK